ncbi:MAG: tetratricopeptide repeat protein [Magnetococcus sp. MYC-9]
MMVQETLPPHEPPVSATSARELYFHGEIDQAWVQYEELHARHPDDPELLQMMGLICAQRGALQQAISYMEQARNLYPQGISLLMNLGVLWKRAGNLDQAMQPFQEVLRLQPDHTDALRQLGQIYLLQQKKQAEAAAAQPPAVYPNPADVAAARDHFFHGRQEQAWSLYEALRATAPDDPELLQMTALICVQRGELDQAITRMTQAHQQLPDSIDLLTNLGKLWKRKGDIDKALENFQEVVRLKPDHVEALCQLGQLLLQRRRQVDAVMELQKAVRLDPTSAPAHNLLSHALRAIVNLGTVYPWGMRHLSRYHQRLAWFYAGSVPDRSGLPSTDTFFVDPQRALQAVHRGTPHLCYYTGEPMADAPACLVCVPTEQREAETFFFSYKRRFPEDIDFDPGVPEERAAADRLLTILANAQQNRLREAHHLARVCQSTQPEFMPDQPLRVFVPATQHRAGFFALARDYARGFERAGCEVLFCCEPLLPEGNDWEVLPFSYWQQKQIAFNPHLLLDINANFDWHSGGLLQTHPDVFKALWFQDPVPLIMSGQPVPWRERDLIYSLDKEFDQPLYRSGAHQVRRDGFCYDEEIFRDYGMPRKHKTVLVGGGYGNFLHAFPGSGRLLALLEEMFAAGEPLTDEVLDHLASQYPYSREDILIRLWLYVVRNMSARWLCELAPELEMEVEIYGYSWEANEAVQPFFKGSLPFGSTALAQVYNEARYTIVPHSFDLQSLRLVEATACGVVPLVYDCRYRANKPHWDNYCLWYRTKEEMRAGLMQHPPESPRHICQGKTYTDFARRVMADVQIELAGMGHTPNTIG